MDASPKIRSVRWGGAVFVFLLALMALAVVWFKESSQQDRVLRTGIVLLGFVILIFVWAILFSGFRGRTRLKIFVGGIALGVFLGTSVRITGVTGDLIPIFGWKWSKGVAVEVASGASKTNRVVGPSFPQFLGPDRNGIVRGIQLETNWTKNPPRELWRHPVGAAWTGFVVADGLAITQEQRSEGEAVVAYELESGKQVWAHLNAARYFTTLGGEGPRANPAISGGRVFTLGGTGILNCLDLATGKVIWSSNMQTEHSAEVPDWGFAGAPLVDGNLVIVSASGKSALVAYEAATGKFAWGGGSESGSYSSPTMMTLGGMRQVVLFNHPQVEGYDPAKGTLLWKHPWGRGHPKCAMPIQVSTNTLMASSGYGYGSELLQVSQTNGSWSVERVWKSNRLKSKFANLILHRNYVYGLDDGILACLDPATGERKWQGERYGHGQLLLVENLILLMTENGEVLLIEPSPESERVMARFRALKGKTWNPPALAGEYLLVRNDQEAACFKVPLALTPALSQRERGN